MQKQRSSRWVCSLKQTLISWFLVEADTVGSGLQYQSPWVFLLIPTIKRRALRLWAPAEFGLRLLTKICSGVTLEPLRSNKKGDTQKQDFAIPNQEPRTFSYSSCPYSAYQSVNTRSNNTLASSCRST